MEPKYYKTGTLTGSYIKKAMSEGLIPVDLIGVRRELGRLQKESEGDIRLLQQTGYDTGERFLSVSDLEFVTDRSRDTIFKKKR